MAKPRIFVSSTYYDLKYIRAGLETFITTLGYDPVLFEHGDIPFHHDKSLEENCLQEVNGADMLVLIVGGRYGATSKDDERKAIEKPNEYFERIRSVTNKEYDSARQRGIPIFIFVEYSVFAEYRTYRQNKENNTIRYAHVDDPRIYEMVDDIMNQPKNNYIKDFSSLEDITEWLRDQWSGIFADLLKRKNNSKPINMLEAQITDLSDIVVSLKKYNEEIIRAVNKSGSDVIISKEKKRIATSRARRFTHEPMIQYLINHFGPKHDIDMSSKKIWSALHSSLDIDRFLVEVLGSAVASEFLESHREMATTEFMELKRRYDGIEDQDDLE